MGHIKIIKKKPHRVKLHALVCGKCGHVYRQYVGETRAEVDELRLRDDGEAIKAHDLGEHGGDSRWFTTSRIVLRAETVLRTGSYKLEDEG